MATRRNSPVEINPVPVHQCSIHLRLEILGNLPFFSGLSAADIEQINTLFVEKGYEQSAPIFFAGDPAGHLYVVADGHVKLMQHTYSGQNVMLDVLSRGEFFGSLLAQPGEEYTETAIAHTPCCLLTIQSQRFSELLQRYPSVSLKVIEKMTQRLQDANQMIRRLSAQSVEGRLAHILLKLGEKLGQQQEIGLLIQLPLARADLAEMAGATVETTSRVLSRFQKEKLIESGRQWVALKNPAGLEAYQEI
jgi:CRP-like cAMP-binding protein